MLKKIFWPVFSILVVFIVAGAVYLALAVFARPAAKPVFTGFPSLAREGDQKIYTNTVVREEYEYLCQDVHIVYLGRAPQELIGLEQEALAQKYPAEEGWTIERVQDVLVFRKRCREFCPEHKNYRHLGISEGCLAVFEGPLGYNQKLLRTEKEIPIESLPVEYQVKLEQAMSFDQQLPEIQAQLRKELEFIGDSALSAGLENLDEYVIPSAFSQLEKPESKAGLNFGLDDGIFAPPGGGSAGFLVEI